MATVRNIGQEEEENTRLTEEFERYALEGLSDDDESILSSPNAPRLTRMIQSQSDEMRNKHDDYDARINFWKDQRVKHWEEKGWDEAGAQVLANRELNIKLMEYESKGRHAASDFYHNDVIESGYEVGSHIKQKPVGELVSNGDPEFDREWAALHERAEKEAGRTFDNAGTTEYASQSLDWTDEDEATLRSKYGD